MLFEHRGITLTEIQGKSQASAYLADKNLTTSRTRRQGELGAGITPTVEHSLPGITDSKRPTSHRLMLILSYLLVPSGTLLSNLEASQFQRVITIVRGGRGEFLQLLSVFQEA